MSGRAPPAHSTFGPMVTRVRGPSGLGGGRREGGRDHADSTRDGPRELAKRRRGSGVARGRMLGRGDRRAGVAACSHAGLDRDAAEYLELELAGDGGPAARPADLVLVV